MSAPTDRAWYANARGKFHAAAGDWIQSGLGECGAAIRNPAWTVTDDAAFRQCVEALGTNPERRMCRRCLRALRPKVTS